MKTTVQIGLSPSLAGGVHVISMHDIGLDEEDAPNERVRPRERRVAETICVAFEMLVFQHVMRLPPPSLGRVINTACNGVRVRFHP